MLPSEICNHLKNILPKYTDLFSNVIEIESLDYVNNVLDGTSLITCVTLNPHYLEQEYQEDYDALSTDDRYVGIFNTIVGNNVVEASFSNGILTIQTEKKHSFVDNKDYEFLFYIQGCDEEEFNTKFRVKKVIDKFNFTAEFESTFSGILTGDMVILEDKSLGYNGYHKIEEIIDENTFKYKVDWLITGDAYPNYMKSDIAECHNRIYISGYLDLDSFIRNNESATEQEEYIEDSRGKWRCGVSITEPFVSKQGSSATESNYGAIFTKDYLQMVTQNIQVHLYCDMRDTNSGLVVKEIIERLRPYMLLLAGSRFFYPTLQQTDPQQIFYAGEIPYQHDNRKYIYTFNFETNYWLTNNDVFIGNQDLYPVNDFTLKYYDLLYSKKIKEDKGEI